MKDISCGHKRQPYKGVEAASIICFYRILYLGYKLLISQWILEKVHFQIIISPGMCLFKCPLIFDTKQ